MAMDEQQLRQIIREVLRRVNEAEPDTFCADTSGLPKAYFIFPENWKAQPGNVYLPVLQQACGKYRCTVILPEHDNSEAVFTAYGCSVAAYSEAGEPEGGSITVFPVADRDLVIRTALCLSGNFEGCWIRKCFEKGAQVYLKKDSPMFTDKEPPAYRKEILAYYQKVKSFGIHFLDEGIGELASEKKKTEGKISRKPRFITTLDLRDVPQNGEFQIHAGDVLTALARDHIEKFGIRIVEE